MTSSCAGTRTCPTSACSRAPDRSVIFDVNDFDETHPGPFEWDVKRLATSFVLAARSNGMPAKAGLEAAQVAASSYREAMGIYCREA